MSSLTCTTCRQKKRKCNGAKPCLRCIKDGLSDHCAYVITNDRGLRRGGACLPCKRKKKKCDAIHPVCSECQTIGKASECVYQHHNANPSTPDVPHPRELRGKSLKDTTGDKQLVDDNQTGGQLHTVARVASKNPVSSFISLTPDAIASALSDISLDDLSLAFRLCFISHRLQLGLVLDYEKQKAIVHGDLFSGFIHPFFIHFSHIFGCHFYQELKSDFMLLYLQSVYVYMTVESLSTIREEVDPLTCAIAHLMVGEMYLYTHHLDFGTRYLKLSAEICARQRIKFIMRPLILSNNTASTTSVGEFQEIERIAFLAQLIYVDTDLFLVAKQQPTLSEESVQEFLCELPIAYPVISKSCPIVLRTKGILLIKEATLYVTKFEQHSVPPKSWYSITTNILNNLSSHIETMVALITRLEQLQEYESCVCLRYSIITCLTSVAELQDARACFENPDEIEYRIRCRETLSKIVDMTRKLGFNDYCLLDPFVGICWTKTIALMKKDVPSGALTQGTSKELADSTTTIKLLSEATARLEISTRLVPSGPGSLCAKFVAMNEKLRTRCPDRIAPEEVNRVFRY